MNIKKQFQHFFWSTFCVIFSFAYCIASEGEITPPLYIAHAGGAIENQTYTNSLEALNLNYGKGFRFFEMDFSWTSDSALVAIHDWGETDTFRQMFYVPPDMTIPTKAQFLQLKSKTGLTQLSLEDVLRWANEKGDVFIVTDVKNDNVKALQKIDTDFRKYKKYIIPQVYKYKEYYEVKKLGYSNIILTLYKMKIDPKEVINFARNNSLFAVTMNERTTQSGLAYYLYRYHTRVYTHTINDINFFNSLRKIGVFGIYTDYIAPLNEQPYTK